MSSQEVIKQFEELTSDASLLNHNSQRDAVQRLSIIVFILSRMDQWAKIATDEFLVTNDQSLKLCIESFNATVNAKLPKATRCLANATKRRFSGISIFGASDGDDNFRTCYEEIQDANREALESLSEADSLSETWDAIEEWGDDMQDALGDCLDGAFDRFDDK